MFTINGYEFSSEPERCGECPAYIMGGAINKAFAGRCQIFGKCTHENKCPVPKKCRKIFDKVMDGDKIRVNVFNNLGRLKK